MLPAFQQMLLFSPFPRHHSFAFQSPAARTDIYKGSFFPQTEIGMPFQILIITSVEGVEDSVARFISLVRARDKLPRLTRKVLILILKKCLSEALLISTHISFVVK